ncbi:MAG: hypothetical protein IKQ61_08945 [Spirochaetales bacterium]|nr:hypothetical protein [Spirochaetales bacterium]
MKTRLMMFVMMMMVLVGVSAYGYGDDYNGVWILDTVNGYMNIGNAKNRVHIISGDHNSVIVMNEKGTALTYFGRVSVTDEDHIVVVTSDDKQIKLVREDYAIYARALAMEKAKGIAKFVGGIALEVALFNVLGKVVKYGAAALFAL